MAALDRLQLRRAGAADAEQIALLHADSWRRHYRGAYSDAFLDGDVAADRRAVWIERLQESNGDTATIAAEAGGALVGFIHVLFHHDPVWGALIDNLHVSFASKGHGIGTRLMAEAARAVLERSDDSGLYLWVLEQNSGAQAFYAARAGRCVERAAVEAPGGVAARLNGSPAKLRYVWPDPALLLNYRIETPSAGRSGAH
jgi:ribosomal protein S18 acetylase RimI-like enzyme